MLGIDQGSNVLCVCVWVCVAKGKTCGAGGAGCCGIMALYMLHAMRAATEHCWHCSHALHCLAFEFAVTANSGAHHIGTPLVSAPLVFMH